MPITYETLNPLPADTRDMMIAELNGLMADILDNHYQSLLAHWNTRGSNFRGLHELFEEYAIGNGAENWCDWVAERISQLGGTVVTTIPFIAAHTSLQEYPTDITDGSDHVRALAVSLSTIIRRLGDGIRLAQSAEDTVTAGILAQVQRSAEKYLWLLEAHVPVSGRNRRAVAGGGRPPASDNQAIPRPGVTLHPRPVDDPGMSAHRRVRRRHHGLGLLGRCRPT
jgi:starvation-inducible DNA-binding protein